MVSRESALSLRELMADTSSKSRKPSANHYDPVAEWEKQQKAKKAAVNRRAEKRYPFTASAEIVDLNTQVKIDARTSDLSSGGCYVDTMNPLALGTEVSVKLSRGGVAFEANARVNYSQPGVGMGIAFAAIGVEQRAVLDYWIAEASGAPTRQMRLPAEMEATPEETPPRDPVLAKLIALLIRYGHISEDEGKELLRELRS
jgi:hypothetical protein